MSGLQKEARHLIPMMVFPDSLSLSVKLQPDKLHWLCNLAGTEGSRLMQISLLLFFQTFQKFLAYPFWGLFISLLQFLYMANAILGLKIYLMQF